MGIIPCAPLQWHHCCRVEDFPFLVERVWKGQVLVLHNLIQQPRFMRASNSLRQTSQDFEPGVWWAIRAVC